MGAGNGGVCPARCSSFLALQPSNGSCTLSHQCKPLISLLFWPVDQRRQLDCPAAFPVTVTEGSGLLVSVASLLGPFAEALSAKGGLCAVISFAMRYMQCCKPHGE